MTSDGAHRSARRLAPQAAHSWSKPPLPNAFRTAGIVSLSPTSLTAPNHFSDTASRTIQDPLAAAHMPVCMTSVMDDGSRNRIDDKDGGGIDSIRKRSRLGGNRQHDEPDMTVATHAAIAASPSPPPSPPPTDTEFESRPVQYTPTAWPASPRTSESSEGGRRWRPAAQPSPTRPDTPPRNSKDGGGGGGGGGAGARAGPPPPAADDDRAGIPRSPVLAPAAAPPPYWLPSGAAPYNRARHGATVSAESLPAGAITLQDNENGGDGDEGASWARSVDVVDYVVVKGGRANIGAFVVYNIRVEMLTGSYVNVRRRYSEFDDFRTRLVRTFPASEAAVPELPPKSVMLKMRPRFLEKRRAGLQYFLNCIILNPEFSGAPVVKDFLFS